MDGVCVSVIRCVEVWVREDGVGSSHGQRKQYPGPSLEGISLYDTGFVTLLAGRTEEETKKFNENKNFVAAKMRELIRGSK